MKIKFILLSIFFGIVLQVNAQSVINDQFFNEVDALLKKNVTNGLVKYDQLKNNSDLKSLINTIETAKVSNLDDNTKQAFYINAYNLLVINSALEKYPLSSVQSVSGFFDSKKRKIAGENLTLNQIEKNKLSIGKTNTHCT